MATRRTGRPSDYTEELADAICEELANSDVSLRQICARAGMPDRCTVLRWLDKHDAFAAKYARAREAQADVVFEEMGDIEGKMMQSGKSRLPSDIGRAVLESKRWRAAKLAAKKYGNTLDLNHRGVIAHREAHDLSDAELEAIAAGRSAGAAGTPPSEGES